MVKELLGIQYKIAKANRTDRRVQNLASYITDIRSFFDNVDHEWLMKMLSHDIADRRFLEIIEKFLKAGIMEDGKYLDSERGTPQGGLC